MQFEITYLPRGCPESTNKIGNVGESSDYRVSIRQVPTGRKRRKKRPCILEKSIATTLTDDIIDFPC